MTQSSQNFFTMCPLSDFMLESKSIEMARFLHLLYSEHCEIGSIGE